MMRAGRVVDVEELKRRGAVARRARRAGEKRVAIVVVL